MNNDQANLNELAASLEYAAWKGFNQSPSEFEDGYKYAMGVAAKLVRQHLANSAEAQRADIPTRPRDTLRVDPSS